jgi:hypothetical protein
VNAPVCQALQARHGLRVTVVRFESCRRRGRRRFHAAVRRVFGWRRG